MMNAPEPAPRAMKAVIASFFFASLAWTAPGTAAESPMAGTWKVKFRCVKVGSQNCMPEWFSLRLFVNDGRLCGTHVSVTRGGNKVDEIGGEEPSLTGQVSGNKATVTFRSAFDGQGKAAITLSRGQLRWQILEQEGEHWLPSDVTLRRVRSTSWGSQLHCRGSQ